jgi:hypothetical protein
MEDADMRMNTLLLIGGVAVAGYMYGPQIRNHVLPFVGSLPILNMRLDPDVTGQVEDRRGQGGGGPLGGPSGGMSGDPGGMNIGRLGPPGGGPGGGMGCWDNVERHPVDMSFCEREHSRRRR